MGQAQFVFFICDYKPRGKQQERMVGQASFAVGANEGKYERMMGECERMTGEYERMTGEYERMVGQDFPLLFPSRYKRK